jgi:ribosome-associated translation inhibitor RaiA
MRFEIFAHGGTVPMELRACAESRVGLAVRRAADRLSFVGVRLRRENAGAADSPVRCQVEAWIRGLGVVTSAHANPDTYVAIDRAAALLEQALLRKLRATDAAGAHEQELYAEATSS